MQTTAVLEKPVTKTTLLGMTNTLCAPCALRSILILLHQSENIEKEALDGWKTFCTAFVFKFDEANFPDKKTFINSLNVIFDIKKQQVEKDNALKASENSQLPKAFVHFLQCLMSKSNPCKGNPLFSKLWNTEIYTQADVKILQYYLPNIPIIPLGSIHDMLTNSFDLHA